MYFNLLCIISVTIVFQCIHSKFTTVEYDDENLPTVLPDDYDCMLWMTKNEIHKMPRVYELYGTQKPIKPNQAGFINITNNFKFLISCKPRKFLNRNISKNGEAAVVCDKGAIMFKTKRYLFVEFMCDGPVR